MSIFKRLGGRNADASIDEESVFNDLDELSDDLPPMDLASYELVDITQSIRAELVIEAGDIEDLAETPAYKSAVARQIHDARDLTVNSISGDESREDISVGSENQSWVSPYVDARGLSPVSREENEKRLAELLEDISDTPDVRPETLTEDKYTEPKAEDVKIGPPMAPPMAADEATLDDNAVVPAHASVRRDGMNLGELRLDIVRITSDIESGEALYRRAQQRVDSLIGFLEQAEVAVSVLDKMEPENRRIKAKNRDLETDVEAQRYKIARFETDLEDQRELAAESKVKNEALRSKLAELTQALTEAHHNAETLTASNDTLRIQAERTKTNLDIETRENNTLREKLVELSAYTEELTDSKLEIQKTVDSATRDYDLLKDRNNSLETENAETRLKLRNAERSNAAMKEEIVEIQQKIVSFKGQHENNLHRRDDKITAISARNTSLENAVKHQEEVIQTANAEIAELRKRNTRHDIEREKFEKIVASQNYQLNVAEKKLSQSSQQLSDLDQRYKDVAEALTMQHRRQSSAGESPSPTTLRESTPRLSERQSLEEWSEAHANPFLAEDSA